MKYLITGINGFTGKYLKKALTTSSNEVYGTSYSDCNDPFIFKCDITNKDEIFNILEKVRPDFIIHLAAISFVKSDAVMMYKTNVIGSLNLLDSLCTLKLNPKKIIIASSAAVYGNSEGLLNESHQTFPINHYGNSKLAMENMTSNYFDKLNIIIVRPFNYTGTGQGDNFLIPKIVSHYLKNSKNIELGNLNVYREYNYIQDVIDVYVLLLKSDIKSEILNISSGNSYNIQNILNVLNEKFNYKIKVKVNPKFIRKNEIINLRGDNTKLKKILNKEDIFQTDIKSTLIKMSNSNVQ